MPGAEPEALSGGEISGIFNTMKWSLHDVQETVPGMLKFRYALITLRPWPYKPRIGTSFWPRNIDCVGI